MTILFCLNCSIYGSRPWRKIRRCRVAFSMHSTTEISSRVYSLIGTQIMILIWSNHPICDSAVCQPCTKNLTFPVHFQGPFVIKVLRINIYYDSMTPLYPPLSPLRLRIWNCMKHFSRLIFAWFSNDWPNQDMLITTCLLWLRDQRRLGWCVSSDCSLHQSMYFSKFFTLRVYRLNIVAWKKSSNKKSYVFQKHGIMI